MDVKAPGKILIVDDTPANLGVLGNTLESEGYEISTAPSGEIALEIANSFSPELIFLDIMMPGMDGFQTCEALKNSLETQDIPVIFMSALNDVDSICKGFDHGGLDYIAKPFRREEVLSRAKTHIQLYKLINERKNYTRTLEDTVKKRTKELHDTRLEVINCLGRAGEFRDNETGMHVVRMSHFARLLGETIGLSEEKSSLLFHASPMHDIGKIGIPDNVLLKPGKLNEEEWEIMKSHVTIGATILSRDDSPLMKTAKIVALHHHEKWDGSGYPNNLKGEAISLEGRIIAICDVFDALTSKRSYKDPWPINKTMELIESSSGKHFEPALVNRFKKIVPEVLKIKEEFADV
ncbi:MAG: two-component system response regulator [Candidatus Nitronauta litoralis]|uniref:Two-component system response regulator n=1 Tax=Candidatus Nitronauta litoralis TaxID=2705533 RepID=A0A7T0BTW3_9BACT|nr:MAG: two-component system response regulator [Candidatus Nitronauta litoralis]